jgi:hypothetical protein
MKVYPTTRLLLIRYLLFQDRRLEPRERRSFDSLRTQVNDLLRAVLKGGDPRKIFKLDRSKKRGERKDSRREQAMCQEVLRLSLLHCVDEATAKEAVAQAFSDRLGVEIGIRTVQRAVKAWRNDPGFRETAIRRYQRLLRLHKLLR